jgi:hypothetical protein
MPFISLKLGKLIDERQCICFVLWALREMDLEDVDLRQAAVTQLETTAKVALYTAIVLACPHKKTYKSQDVRERMLNPPRNQPRRQRYNSKRRWSIVSRLARH